jgi:anti-sigma factor RsiW
MDCQHVTDRMSAFLDRELPNQEHVEIRRHLDACPRCAADCESLSRAWEQVSAVPRAAPRTDLWPRIEARLPRTSRWADWKWPAWSDVRVQAAAVVIAGLLIGGWLEGLAVGVRGSPSRAGVEVRSEPTDVQAFSDVFPGSLAETVLKATSAREISRSGKVTR